MNNLSKYILVFPKAISLANILIFNKNNTKITFYGLWHELNSHYILSNSNMRFLCTMKSNVHRKQIRKVFCMHRHTHSGEYPHAHTHTTTFADKDIKV